MSVEQAVLRIEQARAARAAALDLRGLGLKALPPLPPGLDALRSVELGSNRLAAFPEELLGLASLKRVGLANNRLTELPPGIGAMQRLESLDLSENRLEALPGSVAALVRLVELALHANRLVELPAGLFALKYLERLDVSANLLGHLPSPWGARFSRLCALDASYNRIESLPQGLGRLRALRILNLEHNRLASLDGVESLALLEELDASQNHIVAVPPALERLPRLRRIDLAGNHVLAGPVADGLPAREPARVAAAEAVERMISGGESSGDGVLFFDAVPFSFDFELVLDHGSASRVVDLYYKRLNGHDVSLRLDDGKRLNLSTATRARALDFAAGAGSGQTPARLQFGEARRVAEKRERAAFAVDAVTRMGGSQVVGRDGEIAFASDGLPGLDALPKWQDHPVASQASETPSRRVGLGFADADEPTRLLDASHPLEPASWVLLWCTVSGEQPIEGALGGGVALAAGVHEHADLEVAVFSNPGGFSVEQRSGTLRLAGSGCVVLRPADLPPGAPGDQLASRLFFRIRTPERGGREQLRVHLYHRGLMVQAIDISAWIGRPQDAATDLRMKVDVDYALSSGLQESQLRGLGEHTLSILSNESPGASSGFRFYGGDGEIAASAVVETAQISDVLRIAREVLREVSWGSREAYARDRDSYRYEPHARPDLKEDLVRLAKCGFRIWDVLAQSLAGEGSVDALQDVMRRPGVVQLGLKNASSQLLPLALLYDRPIDTELMNLSGFRLCDAYDKGPACFAGDCPHHGDSRVVCPSGFWGFRHAIGIPVGNLGVDASATVSASELRLFASAYAGEFPLRDPHLQELEKLFGAAAFGKTLSREETIARMQQGGFQVLYFYCHGGMDEFRIPYVLVGGVREDPNRIARATLREKKVNWQAARSLVFINGCHTTALEPEQAIDLVSGFVETAHASGVIGTEVTIFEPLATRFGEAFFGHLLAGADVGTAIRDARRALLLGERPNPLGLVYLPFALATLKLDGLAVSSNPETQ